MPKPVASKLLFFIHKYSKGSKTSKVGVKGPCTNRQLSEPCKIVIVDSHVVVFRGLEMDSYDDWSLVQYHVSFWDSILRTFCNFLGTILYSWSLFL